MAESVRRFHWIVTSFADYTRRLLAAAPHARLF